MLDNILLTCLWCAASLIHKAHISFRVCRVETPAAIKKQWITKTKWASQNCRSLFSIWSLQSAEEKKFALFLMLNIVLTVTWQRPIDEPYMSQVCPHLALSYTYTSLFSLSIYISFCSGKLLSRTQITLHLFSKYEKRLIHSTPLL